MANTLTGLIPVLYEARDIISRELTGAISAVSTDMSGEMAAKDETIRIPITPSVSSSTAISPGLYAPDSGDQVASYVDMTISKSQMVPIRWNGEEQKGFKNNGKYSNYLRDQFAQAMRTLVNEVESDICTAAYQGASRAYGSAGTTPFATDLSAVNYIKQILDDNGAPMADRSLIINSTAGVNLRNLTHLNQANTAGTDATLRRGVLLPISGFDVRESAQVVAHTKGGGTSYQMAELGSIGETALDIDTGSGTVLAGDIVTFAADSNNKYVVNTGVTAAGTIYLGAPGLRATIADNNAMTIGNSYRANFGLVKSAVQLITRAPAMPDSGDCADDVMFLTDPVSGLTFQIAMYKQYRQVHYEVGLAWGVKAIKPEHIAILLG